ncbi:MULTISPECIES: STAS domain-containing protein [Streptomyces]|uniref:STAS domain-containing protein n=1 Tax=Streptomyces TaxID=1883 RepID=UPI001676C35B|nr:MULTISPECIES: STAS domain-containing protein [Streptomyces]MBD3577576.1 STAS domain-containing protein [Streptomyces sp. KD18]GGT09831.1 anti-sigma factor antagonist [Streptomyces toxytricini]
MATAEISLTVVGGGPDTVAVAVSGELDIHTAGRVEWALAGLAGGAERELLLDLAGVTFCDSSGAESLLRVHERCVASGRRLSLRRVQRLPGRVIRALGVDRAVSCSFA